MCRPWAIHLAGFGILCFARDLISLVSKEIKYKSDLTWKTMNPIKTILPFNTSTVSNRFQAFTKVRKGFIMVIYKFFTTLRHVLVRADLSRKSAKPSPLLGDLAWLYSQKKSNFRNKSELMHGHGKRSRVSQVF